MAGEDQFHLGIKGVFITPDKKILLLQRPNLKWDLPGGRAHKKEFPEQTLKREVYEETGFNQLSEFSLIDFFLSQSRIVNALIDVGLIFCIYLCPLEKEFIPILSEEHQSYQWMTLKEGIFFLEKSYGLSFVNKLNDQVAGLKTSI